MSWHSWVIDVLAVLTYRLKNLLKQIVRPIKFDDNSVYHLISVRRRSGGIFRRGEIVGHNIKTKKMYIAQKGDFLISKMQIVHGASALVEEEFDGLNISGSYIALSITNYRKLGANFFNWLSKTPYFYHLTYLASYGVHIEKMTFNLRLFLKSEIKIPEDIQEQHAIVDVLQAADNEINQLEKKLKALEKQKRGLMQKLLTGEVRVK
jgi:type I restriction enzyme S subunit